MAYFHSFCLPAFWLPTVQNACFWSWSLQELYSNCLSGDSLMEVPREQRRCSFEVHLVYCWPFWFNLYHQRALLNYWQLNFFSLGYRHWVNKFQLFLFFHSLFFFPFCFSFAYPDGPTLISMKWLDQWTSEEAALQTRPTGHRLQGSWPDRMILLFPWR